MEVFNRYQIDGESEPVILSLVIILLTIIILLLLYLLSQKILFVSVDQVISSVRQTVNFNSLK